LVYKGKVGDNNFVKIAELPGDKTSFIDDTIKNVNRALSCHHAGESRRRRRQVWRARRSPTGFTRSAARQPAAEDRADTFFANVLDCGGNHELTDKRRREHRRERAVVTLRASGWDIQEERRGRAVHDAVTGDFTFTARGTGRADPRR